VHRQTVGHLPAPIIAHHSAVLDPHSNLPADYPLITDEQLDELQGAYVRAAELAAEAGFDGVDLKACHRYLINELLAGHRRESSRYGGDYVGRTRFLREVAGKVRAAVGDRLELVTRLNVYDGIHHPYGWGARGDRCGPVPEPDLTEPIRLIGQLLVEGHLAAVNVTAGNPYRYSQVNRPADWMAAGEPSATEHPLEGVGRLVELARRVQRAHPGLTTVGTGYTWLRQYFPQFAAAEVSAGDVTIVGLGRGALAYPDFAAALRSRGRLDPQKVCISCGSCTQIMRDGGRSGCVIRDPEVYGPIYREGRFRAAETLRRLADQCRRCADPPCRQACPVGLDVPGFLDALAAGDFRRAYRVLREAMLLPGACGAVCPEAATCASACVRRILGESSVPVGHLHRELAQRAVRAGWAALELPRQVTGRRVAVIGAGPAGLAAAGELLQAGHQVTVFDRAGEAGGKLLSVIPAARLDRSAVRREIEAVFGAVPGERLSWRLNAPLGPDRTLDDVLAEGFDAACLALGLVGASGALGAGRCEGVVEAGQFLAHMNAHPDHRVPETVAVIGGGNSAADAAVLARARGAADVYLLYRRGYAEMPAWPDQRQQVLAAGVHLMLLTQAAGYQTDRTGRLAGVRVVRTRLGEPGPDGRRQPLPVPASESVLPVSLAIEAVGEAVEASAAEVLAGVALAGGIVQVEEETFATSRPGVYAAGDLVNGGTTVAQALAEGRRAGRAICGLLAAGGSQ
jgi:NADPH-dependent glutamate synthase beta subunit-like oxidoreductase/2,4-dienoyl-CoA reductase-like NADH-dependent reductase (Old Yellow Enzyme family)